MARKPLVPSGVAHALALELAEGTMTSEYSSDIAQEIDGFGSHMSYLSAITVCS